MESVDTNVLIGATSTSITLWITGISSIVLPILAAIACTLKLGNKVIHKIIINENSKYKTQYVRDQQTFQYFE